MKTAWAALLAAAIASVAAGQNYQIRVNDGTPLTFASGADATISLGSITTDQTVHVYDPSGTDDSAGRITIQGSVTGSAVVYVFVAGAGESQGTAFNRSSNAIAVGLRDLKGIEFVHPSDPEDTSLRDRAAVAVTILGDLTGFENDDEEFVGITAGTLFRIDVQRTLTVPFYGGGILAPLRATRGDGKVYNLGGDSFPAVDVVNAGWKIAGDIIADSERDANGDPTFTPSVRESWGSIGRVVVGPSIAAPGITGNILAAYGVINEILSTGQIGLDAESRSQIRAGVRIGRIATVDESGALLDKTIFADTDASVRGIRSHIGGLESSLSLIETKGDYVGNITAHDVYGLNDGSGPARSNGRKGIFVEGNVLGDITVEYSWQYADMIARSFRGEIVIGQMLKGAIVAVGTEGSTDPLDGTPKTVVVGFRSDLSDPPRPNLPGFNSVQTAVIHPPFTKYCIDVLGVDARGVA